MITATIVNKMNKRYLRWAMYKQQEPEMLESNRARDWALGHEKWSCKKGTKLGAPN